MISGAQTVDGAASALHSLLFLSKMDTLLVKPFSHNRAARCRTAYAVQAQKHRREADAPDLAREPLEPRLGAAIV